MSYENEMKKSSYGIAYYNYQFGSETIEGELYLKVKIRVKNVDLTCGVSTYGEYWKVTNGIEYKYYNGTGGNSTILPNEDYNFTIIYTGYPSGGLQTLGLSYQGEITGGFLRYSDFYKIET